MGLFTPSIGATLAFPSATVSQATYIPSGTHTISKPILISGNSSLIGKGKVVIQPSEDFEGDSLIVTSKNNQSNITIANLTFDLKGSDSLNTITCNYAKSVYIWRIKTFNGTGGMAGAGIDFNYVTNSIIRNVQGIDQPTHTIALKNCSNIDVSGIHSIRAYHRSVLIDPLCENIHLSDSYLYSARLNNLHISHGSNNVLIDRVHSYFAGINNFAIESADDTEEQSGHNVTFRDCEGYFATQNNFMAEFANYVSIIACRSGFATENGFRFKECNNVTLRDSFSQHNTYRGAAVEGGADYQITSNTFTHNKREGIYTSGSIERFTQENNTLLPNSTGSIKNDAIMLD